MIVFKYFFHHRHMAAVYTLYTAIEFDWKFLKNDKPSIEILRKYAELVHTISISLMIFICSITIVVIFIYQTLPVLQIPEENYTRFWQRPFALKALGKAISYPTFYLIFLNVLLNIIILTALEITFMVLSEHICGLFKITSYHLRYAANEYIKEISGCEKNSDVYTKIILAVRVHIKAMKYIQAIWDMFEIHYVILVCFGIIGATMVFVSFYQSVQTNDEGRILMIILIILLSFISYATLAMYFGQRLIDHSLGVFYDAYNSHWYKIPVKAQKLYLMVLTRSIRGCSFSKGKFFVSSLQGLTAITNTTFSYVTLFYSAKN
ncbi:odorant receptor 22c-like isoform X2 [Bombus flavifrons]